MSEQPGGSVPPSSDGLSVPDAPSAPDGPSWQTEPTVAPPAAHGYAAAPMSYGASWISTRTPEESSTRTQAIIAMTLNIVSVLFCCNPIGIAGAIIAGIGIGRADTDVASAKRLVAWGWGLLIAGVVLVVTGFIIVIVLVAAGGSTTIFGVNTT